jgi:16S rRNA (cytosine1402-N4)-methyltransferase
MVDEIVTVLAPALRSAGAGSPAPVLLDCTLGLGGHSGALLRACPQARLVGLDRDPEALRIARSRLGGCTERIDLIHARFDELGTVLAGRGIANVAAIVFDLGLSSMQIDRTDRGFSYATDAVLDMRMDPAQSLTAADVIASYSQTELTRVLRTFGQERFAARIAAAVVAARRHRPIDTSAQLVDVIFSALPAAARHQPTGHPAKRTFQALRIEVNDELESLRRGLPAAIAALDVGGRIAVLAYHSGEDRIVKQLLTAAARDRAPRDLPVVPVELQPELELLTGKPMRPTWNEMQANPRAGSARLRAATRIRPQTNRRGDQETAK